MPAGQPSKYRPDFAEQIVEFCKDGYSLTAFAGEIGVDRDSISEWAKVHPEFSVAVRRAKAACGRWWEDRSRGITKDGGSSAQSTLVVFALKNLASDDFRERTTTELVGADGGPVAMTIEDKRAAAQAILAATFGDEKKDGG